MNRLACRIVLVAAIAAAAAPLAAQTAGGRGFYDRGQWPAAIEALRPPAESGDAEAQFLMGAILLDGGNGVRKDAVAALRWLGQAAERDHPGAQFELFSLYPTSGGDFAQELAQKTKWAERLARQGKVLTEHRRAQAALCAEYLGREYSMTGRSTRDFVVAYAWLNAAMILGNTAAEIERDLVGNRLSKDDIRSAELLMAEFLR